MLASTVSSPHSPRSPIAARSPEPNGSASVSKAVVPTSNDPITTRSAIRMVRIELRVARYRRPASYTYHAMPCDLQHLRQANTCSNQILKQEPGCARCSRSTLKIHALCLPSATQARGRSCTQTSRRSPGQRVNTLVFAKQRDRPDPARLKHFQERACMLVKTSPRRTDDDILCSRQQESACAKRGR